MGIFKSIIGNLLKKIEPKPHAVEMTQAQADAQASQLILDGDFTPYEIFITDATIPEYYFWDGAEFLSIKSRSNAKANGQVIWGRPDGSFEGGGMRVNGQIMYPLSQSTGALLPYGTSFGNGTYPFSVGYFNTLYTGTSGGLSFVGSGSSAKITASVAAGSGITFRAANGRSLMKVCAQANRGVLVSNVDISPTSEGNVYVSMHIAGNGVSRHGQQTATSVEAIEAITPYLDGCMVYISDATGGAIFTSVGFWGKKAGTWTQFL